jgi:glycosyltransferase involved in cell wall biosynthesis
MQQVQYILLPKFQNDERPVRKTKILFSGNSREISYNNHLIRDKFGILNRHEIIDFLKRTYKKDQRVSFTIKDWKPIWILDFSWSVEKSNRIENKLMGDSYLSVLSQSDFFLCCPGVNMPFCFHTIEAMACGVIPILQYPHLLRPQLRNGENCFSFESTAELKEIIESIMKMEPAEIQKMRREVILYYSRFLSAESIRERMLDQSFSTYYFPVNKISADLFNLPNASS